MATKGTTWLARRSRDLVPALLALAIREWLTADDDVAERELVPVPESVIQNRLVSTGRSGQGERPGSVIQNRPSEHGPSGPVRAAGAGLRPEPLRELNNASMAVTGCT